MKAKRSLVALLTFSLLLSACKVRKTKILYSIYPIQYILTFLGKDSLQMESIQKEDKLAIQATTRKETSSELLKKAGIYFHLGELEPYNSVLKEEIQGTPELKNIDLSSSNAVFDFGRYVKVEKAGEFKQVVEPYYKGEEFEAVDTLKKDLFLWLVPITMLSMSKTVYNNITQLYPENKKIYQTNLEKLSEELISLDEKYQSLANRLLENKEKISFVSVSASFGSWQKAYGFETYPLVISQYGVLPNQAQLAKIEESIKNNQVHYIAHEENLSEEMEILYQTVKKDLNLKEVTLYNLASMPQSEDNQKKDYISLMYENYNQLESMVEKK